jgi:plasmid stability protein
MRKRDNFEQMNIEFPKEKKIKERIKRLAILHNRSMNKEVLDLLERMLRIEEGKAEWDR